MTDPQSLSPLQCSYSTPSQCSNLNCQSHQQHCDTDICTPSSIILWNFFGGSIFYLPTRRKHIWPHRPYSPGQKHNLIPIYEFIPLLVHFNFAWTFWSFQGLASTTSWMSDSFRLIRLSLLSAYKTVSRWGTFFCKGKNLPQNCLDKTCEGLLLDNAKAIKRRTASSSSVTPVKRYLALIATYGQYSISTISTNHIFLSTDNLLPIQIRSVQKI